MSDFFKMITDIAQYPTSLKIIVAICIQLVAVVLICFLFYKPPLKDKPLAEKKPDSVSEKKQVFVPAIDIEFLTTMNDEHNFAYEIIVHNKSEVSISNITVLRRVLDKGNQKTALHPQPVNKLKAQKWVINALKAGEGKKIHTERSESYKQTTYDVVYYDEYHNRYIAGFVGDRDGLTIKKNYKHELEKKKKMKVHSP